MDAPFCYKLTLHSNSQMKTIEQTVKNYYTFYYKLFNKLLKYPRK